MSERYYLAQVVTEKEYGMLNIGKPFGSGIVIDGLGGKGDDLLVITVHEDEEIFRTDLTGKI